MTNLQTTIRQMVLSLDNGSMIISYPEPLSEFDIQDIQETLAIWLRSVRRRPVKVEMVEGDLYAGI